MSQASTIKVVDTAACRVVTGHEQLVEIRFRKHLGSRLPEDSMTYRLTVTEARMLQEKLAQQLPKKE